jgi:ABC-2 type transport system permease protein
VIQKTNKLFFVIERDIRIFFQYKFLVIMRAIWFISQIVLFGLIASQMVNVQGLDYYPYYVGGLAIMTLYSTAVFIGFDIYEEAEHGVFEYMLSLPVSRRQLALGRSIGGGLRAFLYVGPLMAVSLYVIGAVNPLNFLIAFLSLFLFAFGLSGMSITFALLIKSSDRFDIFMGILDALIIRLSTAMYPLTVVTKTNPLYGGLAQFNPVSFASDLFRWGTGVESIITFDNPLVPLLGIVIFFSFFAFVGVLIYDKHIEGGGWQ